jgi:hypothetical protein
MAAVPHATTEKPKELILPDRLALDRTWPTSGRCWRTSARRACSLWPSARISSAAQVHADRVRQIGAAYAGDKNRQLGVQCKDLKERTHFYLKAFAQCGILHRSGLQTLRRRRPALIAEFSFHFSS